MRVVEYTKSTLSPANRALRALGVVAALFSLVVGAFLIANNLRLRSTDPIHTPALQRLLQELKSSPQNEALKEQIREMDWLARRAFFTSQRFNQVGSWLLLGGVAVTVIVFTTLGSYHRRLPYPEPRDSREDLAANARWARQSVTTVGLILVGLALCLALPWKSPLNDPPSAGALSSGFGGEGGPDRREGSGEGEHSSVHGPNMRPNLEVEALPDLPGREMATAGSSSAKKAVPTMPSLSPPAPRVASRAERLRHWPSFRGPASGHAAVTNLPTHWEGKSGKGILWKTAVPLPGFGSPIVWGDRIFLAGANEHQRAIYAVDARNGTLLWEKAVPTGIPSPSERPEVSAETGHAAPTMTTDGVRVFAIFATGDLVALDFAGQPVWAQWLGVPANPYGHSSSLEVFADTVIVQFDRKTNSFVAALDVRTGATRWKTARPGGPSWASPLLLETGGQTELILVAEAFVTAYDPATGQERWRLPCLAKAEVVPSPVAADGLLFVAADHVKFVAVRLATRQVAWENRDSIPGISTPVALGGLLFGGLGDGGIACWDATNGKQLWLQETDDGFYSSPLVAGGRVFLPDRTGRMFIFEATGAGFKSIAQPALGEELVTTPAIYGESLIVRSAKSLFRIGS